MCSATSGAMPAIDWMGKNPKTKAAAEGILGKGVELYPAAANSNN